MAPLDFWKWNVMTQEIAASKKNGIFSRAHRCQLVFALSATRWNGQKSSNSKISGSETSIGLDISPRANDNRASA